MGTIEAVQTWSIALSYIQNPSTVGQGTVSPKRLMELGPYFIAESFADQYEGDQKLTHALRRLV